MSYVCQLTTHAEPIYLTFEPYGSAENIEDADHFETEYAAFDRFLNCFAYPKSYLRMIRDKDVIAAQIGQLHLF
ncbi:MAG: hypothetical protein AB9Q19_01530 [Candidatus Reddybacter sp.]